MGLMVPIEQEMNCLVSVMRGSDHVPFTTDDCVEFGRLAPHITRAASMYGALRRCREELATVNALLDGVPLGMMVVDDDELRVANRARAQHSQRRRCTSPA